jgi:hypothetical protein
MFVIMKGSLFVAKPGSKCSYTSDLQLAQVFRCREVAEASRCPENERVVSVDSILR